MSSAIILTGPQDAAAVVRRADWIGYPCTVSIRKGAGRTNPQNRLAQQWASDVSVQLGDRTPEEVRGYFKLHHGVPIRREDEAFAAAYDRTIRPLPYKAKLDCMMVPIDMPVTRDMTKGGTDPLSRQHPDGVRDDGCPADRPRRTEVREARMSFNRTPLGQRQPPLVSDKLRRSAAGQTCTLRLSCCNGLH